MDSVVETADLRKSFRAGFLSGERIPALNGISLSVGRGEMFGILGPNGAGKTTFLNILSTLLTPDSGRVIVLGEDALTRPGRIRARCNMSSGNANFPWSMTPRELLKFYGMLYGVPRPERRRRTEKLLSFFELESVADRVFQALSTGTKQRVSLAKALVNEPELLFLDEPTVGLDPDIALRIRRGIRSLMKEKPMTVLLTTHYMAEAELLCDRIAFLKAGRVEALGTAAEIKRKVSVESLESAFLELAR